MKTLNNYIQEKLYHQVIDEKLIINKDLNDKEMMFDELIEKSLSTEDSSLLTPRDKSDVEKYWKWQFSVFYNSHKIRISINEREQIINKLSNICDLSSGASQYFCGQNFLDHSWTKKLYSYDFEEFIKTLDTNDNIEKNIICKHDNDNRKLLIYYVYGVKYLFICFCLEDWNTGYVVKLK